MSVSWCFKFYITHIFDRFQSELLYVLVTYVLLILICVLWKGAKRSLWMSLIGYYILVLYITVFSRSTNDGIRYGIIPFSSYHDIANGNYLLLPQVLMNTVMFIPFGFLLKAAFRSWDWKMVLAYGSLFSLLIELLQLALMKGAAEVDDLIHNTFGCVIGYGMAVLLSALRFKYKVVLGR